MRRNLTLVAVVVAVMLSVTAPPGISTARPVDPPAARVKPTPEAQAAWAAAMHRMEVRKWVNAVLMGRLVAHHRAELWRRLVAHVLAERARAQAAVHARSGRYVAGIEVCNGSTLPTCGIVRRESGFNPRAENPSSSASGLYQFIDGTWRSCGTGYGHASWAPVAVQVACARQVWANGRGAGHWALTL